MLNYTIPADTEKVNFNGNDITHVQAGYFKNLSNLAEIHIVGNDISNIDDFAFASVPSVTFIKIRHNKMSVIRENMFSGLQNMDELSIQFNLIHTIEPRSFKTNTALTILALQGNSLQTIHKCMFSGLPNLAILRLYRNNIHTIDPGSFKDTMALTQLELDDNSLQNIPRFIFNPKNHPTSLNDFRILDNPLSYDQFLCWLKQLDTTWISVYDAPSTVCSAPGALSGRTWDTLSTTDLNCGPITMSTGKFYVLICCFPLELRKNSMTVTYQTTMNFLSESVLTDL